MRIATPALLAGLALSLAACSGQGSSALSRLNPLGLFGSPREVAVSSRDAPPAGVARRVDDRGLARQVTSLSVEPMPGGAVIEARGLPPAQGFWDADLVALNGGRPLGGVLAYELRVAPPPVARRVGPPASREVVTGAYVSDAVLSEVASIRVQGLLNAVEVRR